GMPVVVSVLLFVSYSVLSLIGEKSAIEGSLTSTLGAWLSTFVFLPFGLLLTLQVTVDSSFLDADTWRVYWKKIFKDKR
ncbi:MAG: YjgP/YjgQ family permease, partial [Bacteroidales bacterium]|nr:YjgP/YjgQ family permease [Bacteroidales bacterium]